MKNNNLLIGTLIFGMGCGLITETARHEHVPETYYPTTPVVQKEVPYITGSYVDMRRFQFDWGSKCPVSGSL